MFGHDSLPNAQPGRLGLSVHCENRRKLGRGLDGLHKITDMKSKSGLELALVDLKNLQIRSRCQLNPAKVYSPKNDISHGD